MSAAVAILPALDEGAQVVARDAVTHINTIQSRLVADIAEIGRTLIKVKEAVGHGSFLPWVKAEFDWSERTAQNYMSVAERFGSNPQRVAYLPLATVYKLAAPSTPDDLCGRIVGRIEAGEQVPATDIALEITEARREAARRREADKKSPAQKAAKAKRDAARAAAYIADRARWQVEQEQREQARRDASAMIVEKLGPDELARLLELLALGAIGRSDIADAAGVL